jgi:hypothetical protein
MEETSGWANPTKIEDFLFKEVFPRLHRDDILKLTISLVNKAWRALFTSNRVWKSFFLTEWPFVDINTTDHYQKFKDTWASFHKIRCEHPDADISTAMRVCPCMMPLDFETSCYGYICYTKYKDEYLLTSQDCQCPEKIQTKQYFEFPLICQECSQKKQDNTTVYLRYGCAEPKNKWAEAVWIHKELNLDEEILTAISIPNSNNMVAITKNAPKKLILLKIDQDEIESEDLTTCEADSLQISNDGTYIAAYMLKDCLGFVYNLQTRRITFNFERGNYQVHHCMFPVTFFTYENKEYLIAGKDWNRVDLYDPETGESLRERDLTNHQVDYFWGALHVSPDQKRVCTFGWHWGPVGQLTHFSIEKWMQGELYAMEKLEYLSAEGNDWDYPMCWVNDDTIALWGDSNLNIGDHGVPVVRIGKFSTVKEGTPKLVTVPLEESPLVFDEYLISLNPKGIELVDVRDGHVLFIRNQRQVEQVLCYNKHSKQVVSIKKNASKVLVLSSIYYYDK